MINDLTKNEAAILIPIANTKHYGFDASMLVPSEIRGAKLLVGRGLLTRRKSEFDRRKTQYVVTDKGAVIADQLREIHRVEMVEAEARWAAECAEGVVL